MKFQNFKILPSTCITLSALNEIENKIIFLFKKMCLFFFLYWITKDEFLDFCLQFEFSSFQLVILIINKIKNTTFLFLLFYFTFGSFLQQFSTTFCRLYTIESISLFLKSKHFCNIIYQFFANIYDQFSETRLYNNKTENYWIKSQK